MPIAGGGGMSIGNLTAFLGLDSTGFHRGMGRVDASMKRTSGTMASFGAQMGRVFGTAGAILGVIQLTKKIFTLGVAQEQINTSFAVFLGSVEKANALIGELTQFAVLTPFTSGDVFQGARALLAFKVAGDDVLPTLKMLGEISAGTGKNLAQLAVIYGQIKSAGRLMGQDLLQLINIGFNPLNDISEKTGESMASLQDKMRKGAISFDMVKQAFVDATSEGGLFFGMMEKQSKTVGGRLERVQDNLEQIAKGLFALNSGPLNDFVRHLGDITSHVDEIIWLFEQWGKALNVATFLPRAIPKIVTGFDEMNAAVKDGSIGLMGFGGIVVETQKKAVGGWRLITKGTEAADKAYEQYVATQKAAVAAPLQQLKNLEEQKEVLEEIVTLEKLRNWTLPPGGAALPTEVTPQTTNPFAPMISGANQAAKATAALMVNLRNVKLAQDAAALASENAKRKLNNQANAIMMFGDIMGSTLEHMIATQQSFADGMRSMAIQVVDAVMAIITALLLQKAAAGSITIVDAAIKIAAATVIAGVAKGVLRKSLQVGAGVQGLASGGYVTEGGIFQLHKDEMVSLPKGSAVTPAHMAGGGGGRLTTEINLRRLIIELDRERERMGR